MQMINAVIAFKSGSVLRRTPVWAGLGAWLLLLATCSPPGLQAVDLLSSSAKPLAPEDAARTMVVPDGFRVTLFAGEPEVKQPIGFCVDDRGRLWVAEAYNYPRHGTGSGDRIIILDDKDGDGRFDDRVVFYDKLNYVTGIEVGFGGVWVMSPPCLYFIPDRDSDGVPDGEPQVLLDGFGNHANAHNLANGFAWGPDGWLYGTHGRTNWSMIGKPGLDDSERVRFDGGVYRYHPTRHVWEPFADGTTNPWGIDWNDVGEAFICNCVNPHLFHVVPGAHYEPWRNRKSSQFAYERVPTIADHLHYVGLANVRDGIGTEQEADAGGGHAHCGTLVYLGDNWPQRYRNTLFTNNIHGKRINNDLLRRAGSSYVASHGRDIMQSRDSWFMGVTLQLGPGGEVYASDWSDTGECHSTRNTRRETGRIFRISYGDLKRPQVNLEQSSLAELVAYQTHDNDWYVRHARRLLQERYDRGDSMSMVHRQLRRTLHSDLAIPKRLRALWALHVTGGLDEAELSGLLNEENEYLQAWCVRILCENHAPPEDAMRQLIVLAAEGDSQFVRLYLASSLQRLPVERRWELAEALLSRDEDATDPTLPLMTWYGIEPLVHEDLERFVRLATRGKIPNVRQFVARRVASLSERTALKVLCRTLSQPLPVAVARDFATGALQGLAGQRSVSMPVDWPAASRRMLASRDEQLADDAIQLALIFNDPVAMRTLRQQAQDSSLTAGTRNRAINALVAKKSRGLADLLVELINDPATQAAAIRGLADFEHPQTVELLLRQFPRLGTAARQDALQTLASRRTWATKLVSALENQELAETQISAYLARQLQSLGDESLTQRVSRLFGSVRATSQQRAKLIAAYKRELTPARLAQANLAQGRAIFQKQCANCHRLFEVGGTIGPDITGSQRMNLDYLLENLLDPSAAVSKDYTVEMIETTGGRVLTGLPVAETETALTITTINERVVLPKAEIARRAKSPLSMMPDGLLKQLTNRQVCDLVAYLQSKRQVALPD